MSDPLPSSAGRQLPRHVAVIMDGNGRWAQERGLTRIEGHREGAESVREVTRAARKVGIEALTLYAFSSQNWARPAAEVAGLMDLLRDYLESERSEILDNGIRLRAIGHIGRLPAHVRDPLSDLAEASAHNRDMVLTLALSYGGRESLTRAARDLAAKVQRGELDASSITEDTVAAQLPTRELPPLDLLIRTSGEKRLSNFLLWEAAYAELLFVDTLWPDFRRPEFLGALDAYAGRERRFGLTGEQLKSKSP